MRAGNGTTTIDATGIQIESSSAVSDLRSYRFVDTSNNVVGQLTSIFNSSYAQMLITSGNSWTSSPALNKASYLTMYAWGKPLYENRADLGAVSDIFNSAIVRATSNTSLADPNKNIIELLINAAPKLTVDINTTTISNSLSGVAASFSSNVSASRFFASAITGARVYSSVAQAIATGANTAISFNQERYDADINGEIHSTVTNNTRLTSQTNGVYHISATVALTLDTTGNYRRIGLRVNGTTFIALNVYPVFASGTPTYMHISTDYILSPGSYVECVILHDASGPINTVVGGNYSPEFMMHKIN
jgi:hypothetical protein